MNPKPKNASLGARDAFTFFPKQVFTINQAYTKKLPVEGGMKFAMQISTLLNY
jgi:hypothetical protein